MDEEERVEMELRILRTTVDALVMELEVVDHTPFQCPVSA